MAEKRKRRWGDRKEGRYLRSLDPYNRFTPYIMSERNDTNVLFKDRWEISEAESYLRQKRREGMKGLGMLHVVVASYIRTIAKYPGLNRFVSGSRIYARNNIEFVMTVKKRMELDAGETSIKVKFAPTDTLLDVYNKMNEQIEIVKQGLDDTSTDKVADFLIKAPRPILRFLIRIIKWLDYHGWLPQALLDASPFHGSVIVTDLGSLGTPPVYHHLYNFGNLPVFVAFGAKYRENYLRDDGTVGVHRYIDLTADCDERIVDGYYLAKCFKCMFHYLRHPSLLEAPPEEVNEDVD